MKTTCFTLLLFLNYYLVGQVQCTKVKTCLEYFLSIINNDTTYNLISESKYDSLGNLIENISYHNSYELAANKNFDWKTIYSYDANNRLLNEIEYSDGNANPYRTTKHTYLVNDRDLIICDTARNTDTSGLIFFYEYDDFNNIIKKTLRPFWDNWVRFPEDTEDKSIKFAYDDNSNLILIDYTGQGINKKEYFSYDSIGNCIRYDFSGTYKCLPAITHYICKYDAESNLIEKITYSTNLNTYVTHYLYIGKRMYLRIERSDDIKYDRYYLYKYECY